MPEPISAGLDPQTVGATRRGLRLREEMALLFPFLFDYVAYYTAMSAVSVATFFPMFVRSLTASNLAIGLIPAIQMLGGTLPGLFMPPLLQRRKRLKTLFLPMVYLERTPLLLAGLWILFVGDGRPALLLAGVLLLWAAFCAINGCNCITWGSLLARAVPPNLRGRLGWGGAIGAVLSVGVVMGVSRLITRFGLRAGYGLAVTGGAILILLTCASFALIKEDERKDHRRSVSVWSYLAGVPALLRRDRGLNWFLASRMLWTVGATAASFFTVYAMVRLHAGPAEVALLAIALSTGNVAGNVLAGNLADAAGNRLVLILSSLMLVLSSLLAILGGHLWIMFAAFVLNGMGQTAGALAAQNMPLEMGPAEDVATYLAVSIVLPGPVRILAPVVAGAVLGAIGYTWLFALSALAALLGGVAMWGVPEPRKGSPAV
jgi:hypothetical protein